MAKKKDDSSVEEIEAVEEEVVEEVVEEEVVEEVAEKASDDDVEEVAEADDEPPEEVEEPEEEPGPKPQTPALVLILALLNILAAGAFVFLLLMDFSKRSEWSYAVFRHDLDLLGLPMESESGDGISGSREGRSKIALTPDQLKQPFSRRGGSASEPFQHVDEVFGSPIRPEHLTDAILREDIFQGDVGVPVRTLEEEVRRLKTELPGMIDEAAKAYAKTAKGEADRRKKIEDLLLPLTVSAPGVKEMIKVPDPNKPKETLVPYETLVPQIEIIAKRIKDTPAAELDAMLIDAANRRMLVDILAPLDIHRPAKLPADLKAWSDQRLRIFDNAGDPKIIRLEDLKNLLVRRLDLAIADIYDKGLHFGDEWGDQKRTGFERRPAIAYLLVALSYAKKPDGTDLIRKGTRDRAQIIVGWYEYNRALQEYTESLNALFERALTAIKRDRAGQELIDTTGKGTEVGKPAVNPGFVQKHATEIEKLKEISAIIQNRNLRYIDLQGQYAQHVAYLKAREMHEKEVLARVAKAQAKTKVDEAELKVLQDQLAEAQKILKTAVQVNLRLESEIRRHMGLQASIPEEKVPE